MALCKVCLLPVHNDEPPVPSPSSSSGDCNTCREEANEIRGGVEVREFDYDLLTDDDIAEIFGDADPGDYAEDSER